jgi:hypothetical protein
MLSDEKLLQVLPFLYKIIQREFGILESDDLDIDSGLFEDLFKRVAKNMGLGYGVDSFFYFMNAIIDNSENLENESLTLDNLKNPKKKRFQLNITESRTETRKYWGELKISGYYTESQLEKNVYNLYSEGELDLYDYDQVDSEYIDGDGDGVEIESVQEVSSINESNSLYKFLDSLTESEKKFLQDELSKRLL